MHGDFAVLCVKQSGAGRNIPYLVVALDDPALHGGNTSMTRMAPLRRVYRHLIRTLHDFQVKAWGHTCKKKKTF